MKFIIILILILIFFYINQDRWIETFSMYQTFQSFAPLNVYKYPFYPTFMSYWNGYTNFPWWNTSLGNTSNMSYDLRGDPLVIPRSNFVWQNATRFPIYNQGV